MKTIRLLSALAILGAAGGAYAAGQADNAWLMQTPVGQTASAPTPSAAGDTSNVDPINQAVSAES